MYILFKTPEKPEGAQWFSRRRFPNPSQIYDKWAEVEQKPYYPDRIIQEYTIFEKSFESTINKP